MDNGAAQVTTQEQPVRQAEPAELRGLCVVSQGYFLQLPDSFGGADRVWASPGEVVDMDDPYYRALATGHEHKLAPAPKGAKAKEVLDARILAHRREWVEQRERRKRQDDDEQSARKEARDSGVASSIMAPKAPPRAQKPNAKPEAAASA